MGLFGGSSSSTRVSNQALNQQVAAESGIAFGAGGYSPTITRGNTTTKTTISAAKGSTVNYTAPDTETPEIALALNTAIAGGAIQAQNAALYAALETTGEQNTHALDVISGIVSNALAVTSGTQSLPAPSYAAQPQPVTIVTVPGATSEAAAPATAPQSAPVPAPAYVGESSGKTVLILGIAAVALIGLYLYMR